MPHNNDQNASSNHNGAERKNIVNPTDKWKMVQILFFLHGISALIPWASFITASDYFVDYKLKPISSIEQQQHNHQNSSTCANINANQSECVSFGDFIVSNQTYVNSMALVDYRNNFLPYLSTASKVPNIVFQLINLLFSSKHKASSNRLIFSYVVEIGLFIITIALVLIDSSSWPVLFFWLTILIAVLFNTVNGIFQSCIYGIGAKFPMHYTNYITLGFSFSGTIVAIFMIVSLLLSPHPKVVALYYFTFSTITMIAGLFIEFLLRQNKFVKYHVFQNEAIDNDDVKKITVNPIVSYQNPLSVSDSDLSNLRNADSIANNVSIVYESVTGRKSEQNILNVFRQCWLQLLNIVLIYFVSFAIFPAIQAAIRPIDPDGRPLGIGEKFFTPVFCFLFFNAFQTCGNYFAERYMRPTSDTLIYWILARFSFIVYFLVCNYLPDERRWPVLLTHDWQYALGSAAMAFTSGYLSALGMMYAPRCVSPTNASTAAMMSSAAVIVGIVIGVQFSIVLRYLVVNVNLKF